MPATLAANHRVLQGATGRVEAFAAGAAYPQVWLRDSATLLPLVRYHYGRDALDSWLEEHLAHQQENGELFDWFAPGGPERFRADAPHARLVAQAPQALSADRNTTECDQESSAVLAAAGVFAVTGDRAWLSGGVRGRPLLARLDAALEAARARHLDARHGLLVSALTADWGDVSPAHPDQRAIYLDEATPRVLGLYANVLFARAAVELASLHEAAGEASRAARWRAVAADTRAAIVRRLWQPRRGFFRMHLRADGAPARGVGSDDVFALGGNGLAALYGIASDAQAGRIFAEAEARRRRQGVSTISGVLLPPFPAGFFLHPMMRAPFEYQNGGQWDWLGGRFLLAQFRRGGAARARAQLREVAARAAASGGLHEWATRDGRGMGSPTYSGSAGALGAAVYEGLFGIELGHGGLTLSPRLASLGARVRAHEPATGRRVSFDFEPSADRLRLRYEASVPGRGSVRLLLPPGAEAGEATLDGAPQALEAESVGEDRYAVLETDWSAHTLEVRLRRRR
jgi:hypothetical protein